MYVRPHPNTFSALEMVFWQLLKMEKFLVSLLFEMKMRTFSLFVFITEVEFAKFCGQTDQRFIIRDSKRPELYELHCTRNVLV